MSVAVQSKPKLPGFISLLLIIALGISLAKLMWMVITPKTTFNSNSISSSEIAETQRKKVDYGKVISDQHLFGVLKKKPVVKKASPPPKPVVKAAPKVKLDLKLYGIVAYKSRKNGFALISLNRGPQKVYGKGDTIDEGVVVSDVLPGKVLLDNNGTIEELLLPINDNAKNAKDREKNKSKLSLGGAPPPPKIQKSRRSSNTSAPNLSSFRQEVLANPAKLMDIARPSPAIVSGKFIGFRVQPGRKRQLFQELGFRPNDIIVEVNGILLDDASKGAMVLGELAQAADISVRVKRGNKEILIEHSF